MPPKQLGKMPDFHHSMHDVLPSSFRFAQESLQDRSPPILDPMSLQRKLISQKSNSNLLGGIPNAPSLYEMAALTHELDTQGVTTKVKEILLANNVGQKVNYLFKTRLFCCIINKYDEIAFKFVSKRRLV